MTITNVSAREILDSRGNPTVEATVELNDGSIGIAAVPSGASTGVHEALELRDGGKRYGGKGVLKAVKNVNTKIASALAGMDATDQRAIDEKMLALDGTKNKKKLGANAILAVSLASARAAAAANKLPLYQYLRQSFGFEEKEWHMPLATMNVLNGGAHAGWILDFQEFMIVPKQKQFSERVRCGSEVFHALGAELKKKGYSTQVGDEGGYAVPLKSNEEAFKFIMKAIVSAGYKPGKDVVLAMDPAVSELYNAKTKKYELKVDKKKFTNDELTNMFAKWVKKYPIISIEDGLDQDDWDGWVRHTKKLGDKVTLVGDDFFVTNAERLQRGIELCCANAILIKVNQIGTLSETMDAILLAKEHGYKVSVSHRSGETADTFIADLAVAVNADFIKTGSMSRSERVEKYNRVMKIESEVL